MESWCKLRVKWRLIDKHDLMTDSIANIEGALCKVGIIERRKRNENCVFAVRLELHPPLDWRLINVFQFGRNSRFE